MKNEDKIILDLCGGTGSWSKPYKDNGYDVRVITYPEYDVRTYEPPLNVYGILAAPPCTDFSIACNRYWKQKDIDGITAESLSIVYACLDIIRKCKPSFHALENPIGRLKNFIGKPQIIYCYSQFGCEYQKKICLWGDFIPPIPIYSGTYVKQLQDTCFSDFGNLPDDYKATHNKRAQKRSITYPGFAQAFYNANK